MCLRLNRCLSRVLLGPVSDCHRQMEDEEDEKDLELASIQEPETEKWKFRSFLPTK